MSKPWEGKHCKDALTVIRTTVMHEPTMSGLSMSWTANQILRALEKDWEEAQMSKSTSESEISSKIQCNPDGEFCPSCGTAIGEE